MQKRLQVVIEGVIQGVGFRPFIYKVAKSFDLKGFVFNTSDVVNIEVQGEEENLNNFIKEVMENPPPAAKIAKIEYAEIPLKDDEDFQITNSVVKNPSRIYIPKDLCICKDCINELFDPENRRYLYPFINCTNCGPRYSIIEHLPYDRENTTMSDFQMCNDCLEEYNNPQTRRYHAEPNACEKCGPEVLLFDSSENFIASSKDAIELCKKLLEEGNIVAIKGIGGFHLAANAYNDESVFRLRQSKKRGNEPFAIMMPDIESIKEIAYVSSEEKEELLSVERPIVLLEKSDNYNLSESVAPGLKKIGIMLPYTPLHYLIFQNLKINALIMTSGNVHDEPIVSSNDEAFEKLKDMANYFLTNNRRIRRKIDDSVVFFALEERLIQRRSRGFVPEPIEVSFKLKEGVAFGGELKNTISLSKNNLIYISQHIGDLKNKDSFEYMKWVYSDLLELLSIRPEFVACDLHPDYLSTIFSESLNLPLIKIQHHKAHIASVAGSLNLKDKSLIGVSFDGVGFGEDGNSWGGEFFLCNGKDYKRVAHLEYFELPGGDIATKEVWRIAYSLLRKYFGCNIPINFPVEPDKVQIIDFMLKNKMNTPTTSSIGRLFDGVSSLLDLIQTTTFEGEGAMILESIASPLITTSYEPIILKENGEFIIKLEPLITDIISDIKYNISKEEISAKFHNYICSIILKVSNILRDAYSVEDVILSGGVFQNVYILNRIKSILTDEEFNVHLPKDVPINDGGISFGQLYLASLLIS